MWTEPESLTKLIDGVLPYNQFVTVLQSGFYFSHHSFIFTLIFLHVGHLVSFSHLLTFSWTSYYNIIHFFHVFLLSGVLTFHTRHVWTDQWDGVYFISDWTAPLNLEDMPLHLHPWIPEAQKPQMSIQFANQNWTIQCFTLKDIEAGAQRAGWGVGSGHERRDTIEKSFAFPHLLIHQEWIESLG